jgi:hypothetical protein
MFTYRWTHRFTIKPLEAVLDACEAYFTTLDPGRYKLLERNRFSLEFRRGAWRERFLEPGAYVPKFFAVNRTDVTTWPVNLTITARPSPNEFEMTVERQAKLPSGLPLQPGHKEVGQKAFDDETTGLVEYLAEFLKLDEQPDVKANGETP